MAGPSSMKIESTACGCQPVTPAVHGDERGFFSRSACASLYRGRHYATFCPRQPQPVCAWHSPRPAISKPKKPQGKLVQVLTGSVFDVVVDCRPQSPSFGKWHGAILSAENHQRLWVPPGCAHDFAYLATTPTLSISARITITQRAN